MPLWYQRDGALVPRFICRVCLAVHCYWCGREVDRRARSNDPLAPTREHLGRRKGHRPIVLAHKLCNNERGHAEWVPFHEPRRKHQGHIRVMRLIVTFEASNKTAAEGGAQPSTVEA